MKIKYRDPKLILFFFLILCLLKLPYLIYHGLRTPDEFFYLQGAHEMLQGNGLYRDFGELKPPGIFFILGFFKLFFKSIDSSFKVLKIVNLFFQTLSAFFVFKIAFEWFKKLKYGVYAAVGFLVLTSLNFGYWPAHTMLIGLLPLFICFYFFVRDDFALSLSSLFFSGMFLGFAFLINTNVVLFALLFPFFIFRKGTTVKDMIIKSIFSFLGFVVAYIPTFAYLMMKDVFSDYVWWNFQWSTIYMKWYPLIRRIWAFLDNFRELWQWYPFYIFLGIGIHKLYKMRKKENQKRILFVLLVFVISILSRSFFRGAARYSLYVFPGFFLVVLAAFKYIHQIKSKVRNILYSASALLFLVAIVHTNYKGVKLERSSFFEKRKPFIEFIQKETTKDQSIFVWHEAQDVYYYSQRKMGASFFSTSNHLVSRAFKNSNCIKIEIPWNKLMAELKKNKPKLIIDLKPDFQGWWSPTHCPQVNPAFGPIFDPTYDKGYAKPECSKKLIVFCPRLKLHHNRFLNYIRDNYVFYKKVFSS